MAPRIIRDHTAFAGEYEKLAAGDVVVGRLRIRPGEEHLLLDLVSRGIVLLPPAPAQLCSRSKVFQAQILSGYMVPGTRVVYNSNDALALVTEYGRRHPGPVVCKLDRANAGQGVLLFNSVEEVYNNVVLAVLKCPFVVQPFMEECRDVRVVMLDGLEDSYTRNNPDNFRNNLHCGGSSSPFELTEALRRLCREIMRRAGFPYAYLDFLLDAAGNAWLSEINLRGGLRGSTLSQQDHLAAVEKIHTAMVAHHLEERGRG